VELLLEVPGAGVSARTGKTVHGRRRVPPDRRGDRWSRGIVGAGTAETLNVHTTGAA
jgi:hypothetical protein